MAALHHQECVVANESKTRGSGEEGSDHQEGKIENKLHSGSISATGNSGNQRNRKTVSNF